MSTVTPVAPAEPQAQAAAPVTPAPVPAPAASAPVVAPAAVPAAPAQPAAATPPAVGADGKPVAPAPLTLTLPKDSLLEASVIERTVAEAQALGLSQDAAQKLLESKHSEVASYVKTQEAKHTQMTRVEWVSQVKADKDFGGDKFDQTVQLAAKAFDKFGDADLKEALNKTGYGNFPGLVKWAARVGRAMSEDGIVQPGAGSPAGQKTMESVFYGEPVPPAQS